MTMILMDSLVVLAYWTLLIKGWQYVKRARVSPARSLEAMKRHWIAHTAPIAGFILFSVIGLVFSVAHLVSQNITHWPPLDMLEYGQTIAAVGIIFCAASYTNHATDEETPGHEFYLGEHNASAEKD